jgi:hypothetical protein
MRGDAQFPALLGSQAEPAPGEDKLSSFFSRGPWAEGTQALQGSGLSKAGGRDLEGGIGEDLGLELQDGCGHGALT